MRGHEMTERQRVIWLLSMPACAEMNRAMLELTGVSYSTGPICRPIVQRLDNAYPLGKSLFSG